MREAKKGRFEALVKGSQAFFSMYAPECANHRSVLLRAPLLRLFLSHLAVCSHPSRGKQGTMMRVLMTQSGFVPTVDKAPALIAESM